MSSDTYEQLQEKHRELENNLRAARQISRNTIYRIVLLSAGIVGFSVSLFSIPALQQSLDLNIIKYSWYAFLVVIIFGILTLLAEGRIRFATAWKSNQISLWVDKLSDYSARHQVYATLIVAWSLFYPANLTFNKIKAEQERAKFEQTVNGLVVHRLARLGLALAVVENFIFAAFVIGLVLLVLSFVFPA